MKLVPTTKKSKDGELTARRGEQGVERNGRCVKCNGALMLVDSCNIQTCRLFPFSGEWDDLASEYRNGFVNVLWEKTGLKPDGSLVVLDFGCGTGLLTEVLQSQVYSVTCVDAAPLMIEQVEEKIRAREWKNVKAHCAVLANLEESPDNVRQDLESLNGKVDMAVASSVLSFIPQQDLPGTMKKLGELLRPNGGVLCHSDWPKSEQYPDGFTEESALKLYEMAGLEQQSTDVIAIKMMGEDCANVFVGVAVKK